MAIRNNNSKAPTWNKCNSPSILSTVSNKVKKQDRKAKAHTLTSPANTQTANSKSESGSGPTPLSKESVPAPEEDTLPPSPAPPSSSSVDTILPEKLKAMPTSTILIFWMLMQISSPNLKFLEHLLRPGMHILRFWLDQRSLFSEAEGPRAKYSEICMLWIL